MTLIKKEELTQFIEQVKQAYEDKVLSGCAYIKLTDTNKLNKLPLYLVFSDACDTGESLVCKIAYNCDDQQCNYDYDWEILADPKTSEPLTQELIDCDSLSVNYITEIVLNELHSIKKYLK